MTLKLYCLDRSLKWADAAVTGVSVNRLQSMGTERSAQQYSLCRWSSEVARLAESGHPRWSHGWTFERSPLRASYLSFTNSRTKIAQIPTVTGNCTNCASRSAPPRG